ncbi:MULTISPECIES: SH3 domain-containing protein [unclassified Fusibacter]|uniref:SH3 domain-containing protein n=1 Tax=unclassified Fusibacter TaxID=2624464 RepID=UPI001013A533|nr:MULTISPECIES: SH3 domain-containing protein [unclassified Fusibacter]MCK8061476.1 SH3 domain-containing protein [Fusibacter sp. A2]NPE23661.1 hypothetical protein [Fusibacter sp. A1]RXV58840.1 hypothetical protein DWB64_17905 [Fusibacter sp. A1]
MKVYKVIKNRKSDYPNPIILVKGQVVECIQESDKDSSWSGWVMCQTKDNKGWIPHQIVEGTEDNAVIIEDYTAVEFDLELGERLVSLKEMNGWIWCYKEQDSKTRAWAPLDHLELLKNSI